MIRLARPSDLARLADIERSAAARFCGTAVAWAADGDPVPLDELAVAQAACLLWVAQPDAEVRGFALAEPMGAICF